MDSNDEELQVSVIIPIYNSERSVRGLINDMSEQEFSNSDYEVIFVDDNSTDNTYELLQKHSRKSESDIRILKTDKNSGAYVARNLGIERSKGKLLLFLDSDCRVDEDWISNFTENMYESIDAGVGYTKNVTPGLINSLNQEVNERHFREVKKEEQKPMINTRCLALWKKTIGKYGKFRENIRRGGDTEYGLRLLSNDCNISYFEDVVVKHKHRTNLRSELTVRYEQGKTRYHLSKTYSDLFDIPKVSLGMVFGIPISILLILFSFFISPYIILILVAIGLIFLYTIKDFYWFKPYKLTPWRLIYFKSSSLFDGLGIIREAILGENWN